MLFRSKKWSEKVSQIYGYEIPKNLEILVVDTAIIRLPLPYQIRNFIEYRSWQENLKPVIQKLNKEQAIIGHHVSWGSLSLGSGLAHYANFPVILGPVGGGTLALRLSHKHFGIGVFIEYVRLVFTKMITRSVFTVNSVKKARIVLVTNMAANLAIGANQPNVMPASFPMAPVDFNQAYLDPSREVAETQGTAQEIGRAHV